MHLRLKVSGGYPLPTWGQPWISFHWSIGLLQIPGKSIDTICEYWQAGRVHYFLSKFLSNAESQGCRALSWAPKWDLKPPFLPSVWCLFHVLLIFEGKVVGASWLEKSYTCSVHMGLGKDHGAWYRSEFSCSRSGTSIQFTPSSPSRKHLSSWCIPWNLGRKGNIFFHLLSPVQL